MGQGFPGQVPSAKGGGGKSPFAAPLWRAVISCLLATSIFFGDLWLCPDIACGVLYVAPIMLWIGSEGWVLSLLPGAVATMLVLSAALISRPAVPAWPALGNLGLALFAIWSVIAMRARASAARNQLQQACGRLEDQLAAQTGSMRAARAALARMERLAQIDGRPGTVAHELRNPLGVILTSIAVIESRSATEMPHIEAPLARARRAIERCEAIIAEHLDSARAIGHRPEPVVVDDWLNEILGEVRLPDHIEQTRLLRAGRAVVHIDREKLRRALINLIDNACQAMTGGAGATITISSEAGDDKVEITVSDNGPGIPADILARLPEPLLSTKATGTGLGLPTVQRIVEDHAGSLRIESPEGQGARVTLRLPLAG